MSKKEIIITTSILTFSLITGSIMFMVSKKKEEVVRYEVILKDGSSYECSMYNSYENNMTHLTFTDHTRIILPTENIQIIKPKEDEKEFI